MKRELIGSADDLNSLYLTDKLIKIISILGIVHTDHTRHILLLLTLRSRKRENTQLEAPKKRT